jgi:hypothetical protein
VPDAALFLPLFHVFLDNNILCSKMAFHGYIAVEKPSGPEPGFSIFLLKVIFLPQGGGMDGNRQRNHFCYNVKLPDLQCQQCIWLEWSDKERSCLNRRRMICNLYIEEVFGDTVSKTIN